MAAPNYIECEIALRPARVATFVPVSGESGDTVWMHRMIRMLEAYSRTWGGEGNVLVPWLVEQRIRPEFWWPLRKFDPDYVTIFSPSANELRLRDADEYRQWVDKQVEAMGSSSGVTAERARTMLAELIPPNADFDFGTGWAPTMPLGMNGDDVVRFLSPLTEKGHMLLGRFQAGGKPPNPLVDLTDLLRGSDVWVFDGLEELDVRLALMVKSRVGAFSSGFQDSLRPPDHSITKVTVAPSDVDDLVSLAWYGQADQDLMTSGKPPLMTGWREADWTTGAMLARSPFRLGLVGCAWFIPGGAHRPSSKPFVYVFGRTAGDYCLAQCHDRLFSDAAWVPVDAWTMDDPVDAAMLRRLHSDVPELASHRPVRLVSTSLGADDLVALRETIMGVRDDWSDLKPVDSAPSDDWIAPDWKPLRVYDVEHFADDQVEPFLDGVLAGRLKSPLPTALTDLGDQISWQVDVVFRKNELPNRSALSYDLMDRSSRWDCWLRSAQGGVSYRSDKMGLVHGGTAVQHRVARPRLRLPEPDLVFESLLPDAYSCRPSDKGHYTQQMLRLWTGLDSLAGDLQLGPANSLMDAYVSRTALAAGASYVRSDRVFFSLQGMAEVTGEELPAMRLLVDRLLEWSVFRSGLVLTCPRCRDTAWHPMDSVGRVFSCQRCAVVSKLTSPVWKPPGAVEPGVYYGLAEVVYQALQNGGRLPVLTMKGLKESATSFLFSPEMGIWHEGDAKPLMEIDVWAIKDGRVLLGEVRSVDRAKQARKHARLSADDCSKLAAAATLATADEVLLATNARVFSSASVQALEKSLLESVGAGPIPRVRVIESVGA